MQEKYLRAAATMGRSKVRQTFFSDSASSDDDRDDTVKGMQGTSCSSGPNTPMLMSPCGKIVAMQPLSSTSNVKPMTPSPIRTPFAKRGKHDFETVSLNPGTAPTTAPGPTTPSSPLNASSTWADTSFSELQQGYLGNPCESTPTSFECRSRELFRDTPQSARTSRRRRSRNDRSSLLSNSFSARKTSRASRLQQSLLLDDTPLAPLGMSERRRTKGRSSSNTPRSTMSTSSSVPPAEPIETSPDSSPRSATSDPSTSTVRSRRSPSNHFTAPQLPPDTEKRRFNLLAWTLFIAAVVSLAIGCITSNSLGWNDSASASIERTLYHPHAREVVSQSESGLRGKMVQAAGRVSLEDDHKAKKRKTRKTESKTRKAEEKTEKKVEVKPTHKKEASSAKPHTSHSPPKEKKKKNKKKDMYFQHDMRPAIVLPSHLTNANSGIQLPPRIHTSKKHFEDVDPAMYNRRSSSHKRVIYLDESLGRTHPHHRHVKQYPADFTDNTQLYSVLDSSDERLSRMELRDPYEEGECVPMQDWQTTFHPSCNGMHELAVENLGENSGDDVNLFGTKGYWRNAWRLDLQGGATHVEDRDTVVLKTLKFQHNFEDAHFEHDRIDAVAMERLTSSPHVINVFGFCGHSVLTEFADGSRVGELADKSRKKPLARLSIARDIANGLADVHGIDGDGNATFVHLDVNPANVVSIHGTLKLNDFNIGIIRRWNTTSQTPCGFPAQYPNPQWRSPEEARNEQHLTEKVDVFSMGHIFFRLICGHEPWNKLEPGGRPSKDAVNEKVIKGTLPYIPEHVKNSKDPEVVAIRDAMLSCYTYDPKKRPSARNIARSLEKTLEKLKKKQLQKS